MNLKKSSDKFSLLKFFCDGQKVSPSSKSVFSVSVIVLLERLMTNELNLKWLALSSMVGSGFLSELFPWLLLVLSLWCAVLLLKRGW